MRCSVLSLLLLTTACSAKSEDPGLDLVDGALDAGDGGFDPDVGEGGLGADVGDGGTTPTCTGLRCQQVKCDSGKSTTVSGKVYAPNGTLPLYNVIVYVPNGTPAALPTGVSCDRCGAVASGDPIVTALTDATGSFVLKDVPVGKDIPLVVQLGKWRRQVTIPEVKACVDTPFTDASKTRLPKNRTEGDMPRIAVTTGVADKIACMLPKIGIDKAEFGPGNGAKTFAVEFYDGAQIPGYTSSGPPGTPTATVLWNDLAKLKQYDLVVISCEGYESSTEYPGTYGGWPKTQSKTSYQAMTDYLGAGGRMFTTDYEYTWYKYSPDAALKAAMTIPGGAPGGANPMDIDTTFPKGKALADWLKVVEPASTAGKLQCDYVFDNVSASTKVSQVWTRSGATPHPRFVTINAPVGKPAEAQCGKAVHLDAHINMSDKVDATFPAGCTSPLKEGEKAFAFFFFDLAACIQEEGEPPKPPPIK
ncbi:MAG: carboxypeptidase regulatory-like domain-containing protein [Myxococcales bacterium]|nr:carboxypeptidase regulatory-like domain-containing protein [Myxococcales bacterium]